MGTGNSVRPQNVAVAAGVGTPRPENGEPGQVSPVPLLLIRHGESTWNAARRWQGHADPPLSETGRAQARAAASALAPSNPPGRITGSAGRGQIHEPVGVRELPEIGSIWSSDLRRARETAEIIASELGLETRSHPGVKERTAGPWEGLTRDEIEQGWPRYLERRQRPEGFESDTALARRVVPALVEIAGIVDREASGVPAVVTHGGVIGVVDRLAGNQRRRYPNLAAVHIEVDPLTGDITAGPLFELAGPG